MWHTYRFSSTKAMYLKYAFNHIQELKMNRNISSTLKRTLLASSLIVGVFAANSANAFPAVTDWAATVNSGFSTWTWENGVAPTSTSNINPTLGLPSTLSWGKNWNAPYDPSSISVAGGTNGSWAGNLVTGAAAVQTVQFSHTNNPVTGAFLSTATLVDVITLAPVAPWLGPVIPAALSFAIKFKETDNIINTCAAVSNTPCRDIFTIDITGTGLSIGADYSLNQLLKLSPSTEDWYNVKLKLEDFGVLSNAECAAAGATNGCLGFTTEENFTTIKFASLSIQKIPEPGLLGLLGAGLLGMFAARRRKQA